MSELAEDPTAAALLAAVPCYPVPQNGRSPAIDALRGARAGHGLAIGRDGVMLVLRRPWLAVDVPVAGPITAHLPYGSIGEPTAELRCGLMPARCLGRIIEHFEKAMPNEAAAFVIWEEATGIFEVVFPDIEEATPARVVYRGLALPPGWHLVCDVHSHGGMRAFFSATDDADDAHSTKIALVVGHLGREDGPMIATRLCAGGLFLPLPRNPFAADGHDV